METKGLEIELANGLVDFVAGSEEHIVNLSGLKKSYLSDVEKIQAQNDNILALLKGQELENELFENLIQDSNYNRTLAKIDFYLNKVPTVASSLENLNIPSSTQNHENKVKLPRLELSKFNGDTIEWKGFWDQFKSIVHENNNISAIEKFNYLCTLLEDSALSAISGLTLSAENYGQALAILQARYENDQVLIRAYMQKFAQISKIQNSNDIKRLRFLCDSVKTSVGNLKSLRLGSLWFTTCTLVK